MDSLSDCIANLVEGRDLSPAEMRLALAAITSGQCGDVEIAGFLTALRMKGESAAELAAAAQVLRDQAVQLDVAGQTVLDTCGTGGDGLRTFNVSTAAALVIAACGVPVVKHGNRGVSSSSGSADVLAALGVSIDVGPADVVRCLARAGFGFCFAPRFHPAMKHVAGVRKALRFRTLFNLLGPLCNPARPAYQVLGVGRLDLLDCMAAALGQLGTRNAYVVHAEDGLDEVSLGSITHARHVHQGRVVPTSWAPAEFGLSHVSAVQLRVADATESAERIRQVLAGQHGPWRDVAVANAAVGLLASEKVQSVAEGVLAAGKAIDGGKARAVLRQLADDQP